jgi:hypothetical protein
VNDRDRLELRCLGATPEDLRDLDNLDELLSERPVDSGGAWLCLEEWQLALLDRVSAEAFPDLEVWQLAFLERLSADEVFAFLEASLDEEEEEEEEEGWLREPPLWSWPRRDRLRFRVWSGWYGLRLRVRLRRLPPAV